MTSDPPSSEDAGEMPTRPLHARPGLVAVVGAGGAAGTAVRAALTAALPAAGGWPWATWVVNLTGAFLLGLLLERLVRTGPDDGRRRGARLLLGTGFLGGYTTYSTFALDTVTLTGSGNPAGALLYAASTVLAGAVAAAVGIAVGARIAPHRAAAGVPPRQSRAGWPT